MNILFVSSGNSQYVIVPFIRNQAESLKKQGVHVDFFPIIGKGFSGYLKSISKLRIYIRKNNFDIIHAHYSLIGLVALLTFSKKPIVLSLMGSDTYGDYDINGKRILSSYFPMLITQIIQPFVNTLVVKSKNLYKYVYRPKVTNLIPNGVNFDRFKPMDKVICRNELKIPLNKKIILFLADSENPRKNYQLLEKALPHVAQKEIEIINPYPIDNKEFPLYLNACDVFALTSYNEGSPNVIKEAMACNCPIISTDVGDVKEVISGVDGCYITSFNEKDLADKIDKAIDFGSRTKGRKHINHLREEKVATKLIGIYKTLI